MTESKIQTREERIDSAIRSWLQLSDRQFEIYLENRELIIEALQDRKKLTEADPKMKALITKISKELDAKPNKKTSDKNKLLEFNIHLTFMDNPEGFRPKQPVEIAKLSGKTTRSITGTIEGSTAKVKETEIFSDGGELFDWFIKEDGQWLN